MRTRRSLHPPLRPVTLHLLLLVTAVALAVAPRLTLAAAAADLAGAFGISFGEPLPDDLVVRTLPRAELVGEHPPGRQDVWFDETPLPLDDDWVEVSAPVVPRLLARHLPQPRFEVLLDDARHPLRIRAALRCGAQRCDALKEAVREVLATRYTPRRSAPGREPFTGESRFDAGADRVFLRHHRDGTHLLLDYVDVPALRTWSQQHAKAISRWHGDQTRQFALGTRFELAGAFGVRFDTPFRSGGFIPDVEMAVVVPSPYGAFDTGVGAPAYHLTLDPDGHPITIRGRGRFGSPEQAAARKALIVRALREQYGTLAKDLPRHSVARISGDWVVVKQLGSDVELVFIDETGLEHRHDRQRLARAAAAAAEERERRNALRGF